MTALTLFFDGTCPLCVKEMDALKRRDPLNQLKLVDIYSDEMVAYPEINVAQANTILHGIDGQGNTLLGLDAVHQAWKIAGKGWLYAPLRWKFIKPLSDKAYLWFAQNRYRVSGLLTGQSKCENGQCKL